MCSAGHLWCWAEGLCWWHCHLALRCGSAIVLDIVFDISLVDGEVGQVHKLVPQYFWVIWIVLCGKSGEAFLVEVNTQRVITRDHHVHSHVKLLAFDEQWPVNIGRDDGFISLRHLMIALDDSDPSTTAGICWLDDVEFLLVSCNWFYLFKFVGLFWQNPWMWHDTELVRVLQLHAQYIAPKLVFPTQIWRVWKMIDLLIFVQGENVRYLGVPGPQKIEIITSV